MADPASTFSQPAAGERRAVRSLAAQYRVAAQLIHDALQAGELGWVRLVDPEAGRLDDVVIGRPGRIDAYQIKWSEYRHQLTFNDLVTVSKVSGKPYPAPFSLMADGWTSLVKAYPGLRVHAHFLTHDGPSSSDGKRQPGRHVHLQAFLRYAFPSRANWFNPGDSVYAEWSEKIDAIAGATSLTGADLPAFIADSELDLGFDLVDDADPDRGREVEALAHFLFDRVAKGSGPVELRRSDILSGMGWANRYEFRFRHEFPVDDRLYQPIEETVAAIDSALANFSRGYLALVGPPGSGKSTTLTQTLRYRSGIRLVRYYAFVRDDPRTGRGEAQNFLHDLCAALEAMGLGRRSRRSGSFETLQALRDHLAMLLSELGEETSRLGGRAVILVDGLDHIEREQTPDRSLLEELPHPSAIPEGVLIILGSQPVGLSGGSAALRPIRSELNEPGRTLTIGRLARTGVYSMLAAALPAGLIDAAEQDTVFRLTGGYPLALAYLLKRLLGAKDSDATRQLLHDSIESGGDIDVEYAAYWDRIDADAGVRELLALLARIRGTIGLATISELADPQVVERFVKSAAYLFRQLTADRWAFFHNSFRIFLLRKTEVDAFGRPDAKKGRALHLRLAQVANGAVASDSLKWEEFHHLESAGELAMLLAKAQQRYFRQQFLDGRDIDEIVEDIFRALRAAAELGDGVAVARLLLANKELHDRDETLSATGYLEALLEVVPVDRRPQLLMAGEQPAVGDQLALSWAARLHNEVTGEFAEKLFEASEPLAVLSGVERATGRQDSTLKAWARAAWRFRPLDQVVRAISQVRADVLPAVAGDQAADNTEENEELRLTLFVELGIGIQDANDRDAYANLAALLAETQFGETATLRLAFRAARLGAGGEAGVIDPAVAMTKVLAMVPAQSLSPVDAAYFADVLVRLPGFEGRADEYLARCPDPLTVEELRQYGEEAFTPLEGLFRQARASAARRMSLDPMSIKTPQKSWYVGRAIFQRLVVIVGTVWGEAVRGQRLSPESFVRRLMPVLTFRRRPWREIHDWHDWTAMNDASSQLYERVVLAADAHGPGVLEATLDALVAEWRRHSKGEPAWPLAVRRDVVMAAFRLDGNRSRSEKLLTEIDGAVEPSWELQDRMREFAASARAWHELGRQGPAEAILQAMVIQSFGVFHDKDRQISDWVGWAKRLVESGKEPALVERAYKTLLPIVPVLFEASRGRGTSEATGDLVGALATRWPAPALRVAEWLLDNSFANRAIVLASLLTAELRSGDDRRIAEGLIAASRLLLPFATYEKSLGDAVRHLRESGMLEHPTIQEARAAFVRSASTIAQAGEAYLGDMTGEKVAEPEDGDNAPDEGEKQESPPLILSDGTALDQPSIEDLALRPQDFATALNTASGGQGIDWGPVIVTLFAKGSGTSVRQSAEQILALPSISTSDLNVLVQEAARSGDLDLAERAVARLIEKGKAFGWVKYYDGGSRYAVTRAMRLADPANGRLKALRLFVSDYVSQGLTPRDMLIYLDDLLLEFVDYLPLPELWAEIEEHVQQLADFIDSPHVAPPLALSGNSEVAATSVRLLMRDMSELPSTLAWEARRGLVDIVLMSPAEPVVPREIDQALKGNYREQAAALATLQGLAYARPEAARPFVVALEQLSWAPSAVVRLAAQSSLSALQQELPNAPVNSTLPAFYRLVVPEASKTGTSLSGEWSPPGEPLPDTDDPFDLTRMYHGSLKAIAEETSLGFDLLVRRMAQLMPAVAAPAEWSAETERAHKDRYETIGIKLTYRRPRALVAQHAFGMLVSELCDSQVLQWPPDHVRHLLVVADPIVNMAHPVSQPAWLRVGKIRDLGSSLESWMDQTSDVLPVLPELANDGRIVLCELSRQVNLDRDRETETRLSVVAHNDWWFHDQYEPLVDNLAHEERYLASDYPHLRGFRKDAPITVIGGGSIFADARFVAFNPYLARRLGWSTAKEGLFRWVDGVGELMVESIFWTKGNPELHDSGGGYDSGGDGWLVLASPKAWSDILPHLTYFSRHRVVARGTGYSREGNRQVRVVRDKAALAL